MLRAGAVAGAAAVTAATGIVRSGTASAATAGTSGGKAPPYPQGVTDTSHCTAGVAEIFRGFYTAKSEHDAARLMTYFSKTDAFYIDASSGSVWPSWESLNDLFTHFFASGLPADAISYPLRIVGDERSALVEFEDTPELFGSELRILGSVTFDDQRKIIRWIDYWDGRSALVQNQIRPGYPAYFKDQVQRADPRVVSVARRLQQAYSAGDVAGALALMSFDVVHEDMAAHARLRGQLQVGRYYTRALSQVPYGAGASLAHVEGGVQGGGYEWSASPAASPMRRGHTCLELDQAGQISRLTTIYDSSLLSYPAYQALVGLSAEAPR